MPRLLKLRERPACEGLAVAQAARYRLLLRILRTAATDQALQAAAQESFAWLTARIAALRATTATPGARDPSVMAAWSAVHDFASRLQESLPFNLSEAGMHESERRCGYTPSGSGSTRRA